MGNQKILEEQLDPTYEPTAEEIQEYAEWLGIDVESEKDLLWIARQGLTAKLPTQWKPCQNEDGQLYYFNFDTGESVWEHPCDTVSKQLYKKEKSCPIVRPSHGSLGLTPSDVQLRTNMHERYLSTKSGDSASDDRHMYTSCDVPPELGAVECVFMDVNPDQCQKLLKADPDTDQARCTLGDADIDVRIYTQGDESEERNIDGALLHVACTHTVEASPSDILYDHVTQRYTDADTKLLEQTVQDAVSRLKAELEVKQSKALLELQQSFDKKCREMQLKYSSELQHLKAQMVAPRTCRKQSHAVQEPSPTLAISLSTAHDERHVLKQACTSQMDSTDIDIRSQPRGRLAFVAENALGSDAGFDMPAQHAEDDTHERYARDDNQATVSEQLTSYEDGIITGDSTNGLAVAGIPFAQIHRDKQPGYQQSAATQQDGSDLQTSAEITTRQSVCAVLDRLVKTDNKVCKTTPPPFPGVPENSEGTNENSLRKQALGFFKEQKKLLRRRQDAMHKAREEWNRNAEMLACVQASPARSEMVSMLKQVHHTLEAQAQRLNDDAMQLAAAKERMGITNWHSGSVESHCATMGLKRVQQDRVDSKTACLRRAIQKQERRTSASTLGDISNHAEAEHALHSHAKWLRSLREQIVKVSQRSERKQGSQTRDGQRSGILIPDGAIVHNF